MTVKEFTLTNFAMSVNAKAIVVVDCWAAWCKACKDFAPVFEEAADRHPEHIFGKVNTEAEKELVAKLGVEHIPTLLLYRDGILLLRQPGYVDAAGLDDVVRQAESLDMNLVRSELS